MKKLMLAAAMMVATVSASAQVYVGGGIGFSSYDSGVEGSSSQSSFEILPEIGYHLDDSWDLGIQLGYGETEKTADLEKLGVSGKKASAFTIKPYARYNFVKWNNVKLFVEGSVSYANAKTESKVGNDVKVNEFKIGVAPGVAINAGPKFTFVTKFGWLGYETAKADYEGAKAASEFGFNVSGESIQFSLLYNL